MAFESRNPATEEVWESYPELEVAELERRLQQTAAAAGSWRDTSFAERSRCMRAAADALRARKVEYAQLMAREMGKPLVQGEAEAEKCAWVCEYYAEHAEGFLAPVAIESDVQSSYVRFDPLGAVLAIMPWNFPFWQVFRFAAPGLMAGNLALVKHAPNVPGCALAIETLLRESGFPEAVYQNLFLSVKQTEELIDHPLVRAVTLTGSDRAGASVAARAGARIKKTVLELGGSDPFIVLDDVDVAAVAAAACGTRTLNSGQSCIAAKRFIVMDAVADAFVSAFRGELEALRVGDPLEPETQVGPLARLDLLGNLERQVERAVQQGARLLTGGKRLEGKGYFYPPTLLEVSPDNIAAQEETFGPVAAVLRVGSEAEAVQVANATRYGLGASVWSGDARRAEALAPRIEAGCVFVNGFVKSDPRLPFGGIKDSGYGRELSQQGIREFVNVKTVCVE